MSSAVARGPMLETDDAPRPTTPLAAVPFAFMTVVVAVQGGHLVEHVVQLVQVFGLGVADDDALGLLGSVVQFNGTEEWLHLAYNLAYLLALYVLIIPLLRLTPKVVPHWAFNAFIVASVFVESWHIVEHGVIISNVIENDGCPCPGIGDRALGLSDTILHFVYNLVAYSGILAAYVYVFRARHLARPSHLEPGPPSVHT